MFVCAGVDRGTGAALRAQADSAGDAGALLLTGPVDDGVLLNLYRGAAMLLYPSRYEGFGLPVLEAMQCGVPVAGANGSSIPELTGDAALLIDALDMDGWIRAIDTLLDPSHRAAYGAAGLRRAAAFGWERTARETLAVFRRAAAMTRGAPA
jgi:alpha-1,3-rhamnosyl/mannosyltransferase